MGGKYWRPRDRIFLTRRAAAVLWRKIYHHTRTQDKKMLNLIKALQSRQSGVAALPRQTARQLQLQIRSEQSSQFCICRSSCFSTVVQYRLFVLFILSLAALHNISNSIFGFASSLLFLNFLFVRRTVLCYAEPGWEWLAGPVQRVDRVQCSGV